ncbi:spore germination protein [Bacillus sp. P14.5]|uniref:spore germination protein n=1 Tax=Bacillus sp. P14.5 TaxID=1983400 RepID=UPI001F06E6F2|nr:spore germination protein [Bacillus sp. P14.5]
MKEEIKNSLKQSADLAFHEIEKEEHSLLIIYLDNIINSDQLHQHIIKPLERTSEELDPKSIANNINIGKISITNKLIDITEAILNGNVYIYGQGQACGVLADIAEKASRSLEKAETESLVFGPKVAFTEDLSTNMNVIRTNINDPNLCVEEFILGSRVKTKTYLIYIKDIAEEENVHTIKQRMKDLEVDSIIDSSVLAQMIEDNSFTVFPQLITTELPDRFSISLLHGKLGILVDRSPQAIIGPSTFLNFFESTEDLYMRWNMGTFLRMLRFTAIMLSVLLTPAYVAVLTYHYEVIPSSLLVSLGESRSKVPFPPVFEALLLEFIIELLREAGARLPTKVGQTMGIVGGIVIGQAAVEAGFTSNILIIIIAISALGSFTAPSYAIGTAVRIIRFPIIIFAGLYGGVGIVFAFSFLLIHLLKLTTLGRPYLSPIYPLNLSDLRYSLFRLPFQYMGKRPEANSPVDSEKMRAKKKTEKKM